MFATCIGLNAFAQPQVVEGEEGFEMEVVASGILNNPNELISGPDAWLWITVRSGNRVMRVTLSKKKTGQTAQSIH